MAATAPLVLDIDFYQLPGLKILISAVRAQGGSPGPGILSASFQLRLAAWDPQWDRKTYKSQDKASQYLRVALRALGYPDKHPHFTWIDTTSPYASQSPSDSYEEEDDDMLVLDDEDA